MEFVYDRKANPQRPIRFDRIKMKSLKIGEKLSLSYAMAQSSKLFVLESRVFRRLESTRELPKELAEKGKITCSKKELNTVRHEKKIQYYRLKLF